MTHKQRLERARQARLALDEFLTPAFEIVEAEYADKMITAAASVDPRATEKIARLGIAIQAVRQARTQIEAIVADGDEARIAIEREKRLESLSPTARRLLNIGIA